MSYSGPQYMSRYSTRFTSTTSKGRWLEGGEVVLQNLNKEIQNIKDGITRKGMRKSVTIVLRQAKIYTPVDTGAMIGSYSTDVYNEEDKIIGEIKVGGSGKKAYALYVHEMPDDYNFTKPGSGPKFLERALFEKKDEILEALAESIKL